MDKETCERTLRKLSSSAGSADRIHAYRHAADLVKQIKETEAKPKAKVKKTL